MHPTLQALQCRMLRQDTVEGASLLGEVRTRSWCSLPATTAGSAVSQDPLQTRTPLQFGPSQQKRHCDCDYSLSMIFRPL